MVPQFSLNSHSFPKEHVPLKWKACLSMTCDGLALTAILSSDVCLCETNLCQEAVSFSSSHSIFCLDWFCVRCLECHQNRHVFVNTVANSVGKSLTLKLKQNEACNHTFGQKCTLSPQFAFIDQFPHIVKKLECGFAFVRCPVLVAARHTTDHFGSISAVVHSWVAEKQFSDTTQRKKMFRTTECNISRKNKTAGALSIFPTLKESLKFLPHIQLAQLACVRS